MRNKIFVACFLLCCFSGNKIFAQIFQRTIGGASFDVGQCLQLTTDGGYIITGTTYSFGGGAADIYLVKTNFAGDTLWTKTFGSPLDDSGIWVEQTTDGGYIIAGHTYGFGAGMSDCWVIKTNATGDLVWSQTYGGAENDFANCVKETADGGFVFAGSTRSNGAGYDDVYIVKTNSFGNISWTSTIGGINEDNAATIQQTTDGGFLVTGSTDSYGAGAKDILVIKTDSSGNSSWMKVFGGFANDIATTAQQTADGGYIIGGGVNSFSFNSTTDFFLIKINAAGVMSWTKGYGGASYDRGQSVEQTNDGGYIYCGFILACPNCAADILLIRTDAAGDTLWTRSYGGISEETGYTVHETADGGFIVTGWVASFGMGNYDIYLIKTDANGYSGCNEPATTATVFVPAMQELSVSATAGSGGQVGVPVTLTGSGGSSTVLCTTVGINENTADNALVIYPNPFANSVTVLNTLPDGKIKIHDVTGKMEMILNSNDGNTIINTSNLKAGVYVLYYIKNNVTTVSKLVKL
jgi:hypothetical protein